MEDITEVNPSEKEEDHEEEEEDEEGKEKEDNEEGEEEEDDEEEKTEGKKSKKSKKSQKSKKELKLTQKSSPISKDKDKDKKPSQTSSKLVLDASSKNSNLPLYNDVMKENSQKNPPSNHYSNKYKSSEVSSKVSKLSKITKKSKNSGLPTFNNIITSDANQDINSPSLHYSEKYDKASNKSKSNKGSELPTFNDVIHSVPNKESQPPSVHYSSKYGKNLKKIDKSSLSTFKEVITDQNQEINPPSVHYSDKYGKKSLNSIKTKSKSKKSENSLNSILPTFNQITTEQTENQNPPSVHYSEKYEKNSMNSKRSKESKKSKASKASKISKGKASSNLITFDEYMNTKEDRETKPPSVHYSEKYGKIEEVKNYEKKSEKISEGLPMFNDYINSDPELNLNFQNVNYQRRYDKDSNQEIKSKTSKKSKASKISLKYKIGKVEPERVIVLDPKEKENLPKLYCYNCKKFPLEPLNCSDCNCILCGDCMKDKTKCLQCSSLFKNKPLDADLQKTFSACKILCKYTPCGCTEQLFPKDLLEHEKVCKENKKKCENCGEIMKYEKYLVHYKLCGLDLAQCETCGYKDSIHEYEKTSKKIEHIKHILFPEIEEIVRKEVEKAVYAINDSLDRREALKEPPDHKFEDELNNKILNIQQLLLNIQPKDYLDRNDDLAKMTKAKLLDRKIKNVKLVLTIPSKIDNAFECNDKYCIIQTYKNDNFTIYPNIKYGINCYNLTSSKDITILPKAFESNITCMASCQNPKKNMSYFAASSYDRTIKVYSIEDGFKKIKTYREIFEDYSNFSIDIYCYNNQIILLAGNENLKQVKVLYPEEGDKEKSLMKKMTCNNKILFLKHNPGNEEEFFMGNDEGIFLYNIFSLIGEGDDANKKIETEKEYIDKDAEKSKHLCITFIEEDKNFFIEGDSLGIVRVWSIKEGELRKKIARGILKYQINSLAPWSGRTIIGGTKDGKIIIYDIFDGIAVGEVGEHNGYVYCVKTEESWKYEKIVTSCGFDGELKIWATLDY